MTDDILAMLEMGNWKVDKNDGGVCVTMENIYYGRAWRCERSTDPLRTYEDPFKLSNMESLR